MSPKPIVGIDLGTTFSVVAHVGPAGHVTCLPNGDQETLTPSVVMLDDEDRFVVGGRARGAVTTCPDRVAEAFKRRMGDEGGGRRLGDRDCSPEFLSSLVLRQLAGDAQRTLGEIAGAVVTVPAYFGDRQRAATLEAAKLAGLDVAALINEPTAAALAHAFDSYVAAGGDPSDLERASIASTAPGVSVICDLGGGTFDVTVVRINGSEFEVLATGGALNLGGRDWDERIVDAMQRHLFDHSGPDPHGDSRAQARMHVEAQTAKHVLSVKNEVSVRPPYERVERMNLTREAFEGLSETLVDRFRETVDRIMGDAAVTWSGVDDLLLVGGATRMPMIRRAAAEMSGLTPNTRLQPDLIVAQGAAVYAAILRVQGDIAGPDLSGIENVTDATPYSLATLAEQSPHVHGFDDAFAAAAGAVKVVDVNARSLGVMVRSRRHGQKVNNILIPRNSPLPASCRRTFLTNKESQTRVRIPVLEGEVRDARGCTEVGLCTIDRLPANLPQGSPVEVTISYDTNGTVRVQAEELSTHTAAQTVLERRTLGRGGRDAKTTDTLEALADAVAQVAGR